MNEYSGSGYKLGEPRDLHALDLRGSEVWELGVFELLAAVQRIWPNGTVARSTQACDL